jgi:hypothetical protein
MVAAPEDRKLLDRFTRLGTLQAQLAQKLRLSILSTTRLDSGKLSERVEPAADPALLGGYTRPN